MAESGPVPFLTAKFLAAAMPPCRDPAGWASPLRLACHRYGITTPSRVACFIAQVGHESGDLNRLSESLDYSPAGLMQTWPTRFDLARARQLGRNLAHPADQELIAEAVYGRRLGNSYPGDAWRYRGAGLIQVTGYANHDAVAQAFHLATADVPEWLRTQEGAALSAAWYWDSRKLNPLADAEAIDKISRLVNGGSNGLEDRRARFVRARRLL